jgi:hypothetical protein
MVIAPGYVVSSDCREFATFEEDAKLRVRAITVKLRLRQSGDIADSDDPRDSLCAEQEQD